jgi:hypothetical protein
MSQEHARPDRRGFSLDERFEFGKFTVAEICELALRSRTAVYNDIAAGLLPIEKHGRATRIAGPHAKRYLNLHSTNAA